MQMSWTWGPGCTISLGEFACSFSLSLFPSPPSPFFPSSLSPLFPFPLIPFPPLPPVSTSPHIFVSPPFAHRPLHLPPPAPLSLLEDRDLGVTTSAMSLLLGFASHNPAAFEPLVPYVISILLNMVINRMCPQEYLYYRIPCPWLQVKCLRFLQYYKEPEGMLQEQLLEILLKLLSTTAASESVNKSNADYAVLFEGMALVVSYGPEASAVLRELTHSLLGRFVEVLDANVRYLALDMLARLAKQESAADMAPYQAAVLDALKDGDVSVRKRALDLIYLLTDYNNTEVVVAELITVLAASEASIKDEMVVKIAILAERFYPSFRWYVDTMVQVILVAGDSVAEQVSGDCV